MNFLKKLFGLTYKERDNLGTRRDTSEAQRASMAGAMIRGDGARPSVFYKFATKAAATKALSSVSCIEKASDTGNLIATDTVEFGVFHDPNGFWVAFVLDAGLPVELFEEAVERFSNHGGQELEKHAPNPETARPIKAKANSKPKGKVTFCHVIDLSQQGGVGTKRIYKAPSREVANEFLRKQRVTKPCFYIEIETPEGWCGKDKDGVYTF